jgi:hypothetical protein
MCALLIVAYQVLNKPVKAPAPLVSDAIAKELMARQKDRIDGPIYTVLSNSYMGSAPFLIEKTLPLSANDCVSICNGDINCGGFQIHPDGATCDILTSSNIGGYPFTNSGWNYYQLQNYSPLKIVSMIINQSPGGTGAQVGQTVTNASPEKCSQLCNLNSDCTEFTIGPSGCKLWNNKDPSYVQPLAAQGTNYYTLSTAQTLPAFSSTSSS